MPPIAIRCYAAGLATSLANEADARRWLDGQAVGWDSATRFSFAVVADDDDHAPFGHMVVKVGTAGVAEVGYWTATQARGRGIAARALETASRWALRTHLVRLTRLGLLHAETNWASCRVAEKCGYGLHDLLPAAPPAFPVGGHRHVRTSSGSRCTRPLAYGTHGVRASAGSGSMRACPLLPRSGDPRTW